jgi:hypothetical protein
MGHGSRVVRHNGCPKMRKKAPQESNESSDAWSRFERAVDAAVKSGPMHKGAKSPKKMEDAKDAHGKRNSRDNGGDNSGD